MTYDAGEVHAFVRTREALVREAARVPAELRTTPFVGHWNLMDVLAHLIGWDYTNLQAIQSLRAGSVPDFYRHYDPGWATYNRQLVERYGMEDWQALLASLQRSQVAVIEVLRGLNREELTRELRQPDRRRPVTLAGILRAAIRDEREHMEQIRIFVAAGQRDG